MVWPFKRSSGKYYYVDSEQVLKITSSIRNLLSVIQDDDGSSSIKTKKTSSLSHTQRTNIVHTISVLSDFVNHIKDKDSFPNYFAQNLQELLHNEEARLEEMQAHERTLRTGDSTLSLSHHIQLQREAIEKLKVFIAQLR